MAEWFNAAVLKTVDGDEPSGGSNPSLSAFTVGHFYLFPSINFGELSSLGFFYFIGKS
jgi:hypothetical protein